MYPYNGILFSHKKEWCIDTCYNTDESGKHCAKWKKLVTKDRIVYDSLHMIFQKREICRESRPVFAHGWQGYGGIKRGQWFAHGWQGYGGIKRGWWFAHGWQGYGGIKRGRWNTSLLVWWLRLWAPSAGGVGSIPSRGTRPCTPQLRPGIGK